MMDFYLTCVLVFHKSQYSTSVHYRIADAGNNYLNLFLINISPPGINKCIVNYLTDNPESYEEY
jgi:hypothetical protein